MAWVSAGTDTSYRAEGLTNGTAYEFEVRAVNLHGNGESASSPGTPSERITGIPKAVQVLQVKATDSSRAELSWTRPANGTDRVTWPGDGFSQIQGYRIEVCRTTCGDEANWYAVVPNTRKFAHKYVHQVLAPGVIREKRGGPSGAGRRAIPCMSSALRRAARSRSRPPASPSTIRTGPTLPSGCSRRSPFRKSGRAGAATR